MKSSATKSCDHDCKAYDYDWKGIAHAVAFLPLQNPSQIFDCGRGD